MLKKLSGRLRPTFFVFIDVLIFVFMIENDDILIPIEIKGFNSTETFYLNKSEYERNRLQYENSLTNWYNFLH